MNQDYQIRCGKLADVEQVAKIWHEMMVYHQSISEHDYELVKDASELFKKFYRTHVRSKNKIAIVAEYEDRIVGYLIGLKDSRPPVFKTKYLGFVSDIAVTSVMRNRGIGRALINKFILWAKEHGLNYFVLQVERKNEVGLKFYDKLGFETIMQVKKKII
jgi:ribosomal protein S18 acetylase RimI-like enzyme